MRIKHQGPSRNIDPQRATHVKTPRPPTPRTSNSTLSNYLLSIALCLPLAANACSKVKDWSDAWPSKPIKDPAKWRAQMIKKEGCPDRTGSEAAAQHDLEFSGVKLVYDPCNSGRNDMYIVFYPTASKSSDRKYCPIGSTGGTTMAELPPGKNGYVRIQSAWHNGYEDTTVSRQEFRPSGIVVLGRIDTKDRWPDVTLPLR